MKNNIHFMHAGNETVGKNVLWCGDRSYVQIMYTIIVDLRELCVCVFKHVFNYVCRLL